jgi:phosphoenolpyruvate carboxykinase (ATP)
LITAALNGELENIDYDTLPVFGLRFPKACPGVPNNILNPRETWNDKSGWDAKANDLAAAFVKNFAQYAEGTSAEILAAAPKAEMMA